MARPLDDEETRAFLATGTRTGKLAWVTKSGRPAVTPVWFVLDEHDAGFDLVFNTARASGKAKAFARDPRVSLVVDEEHPPYGFVKIDGQVELIDEPTTRLAFATRIGGRYMGADRAEDFGARNGGDDEWLVRLRPDRVTAFADISG
ncbi:MAG: PPOX class F420-dependent oxidoreductase [Acidimicrobiales bacterium]